MSCSVVRGGQKCGTTSLYAWLSNHPNISLARVKETRFFDKDWHLGSSFCRINYPLLFQSKARCKVIGDVCPSYLSHPHCARRISQLLPDAKILILLRNPAERALSHFKHSRRIGREPIESFDEALAAEDRRLDLIERQLESGELQYSQQFNDWGHFRRGLYLKQIRRFYDVFGKDQILIVDSAQYLSQTAMILNAIEDFLGVKRHHWDAVVSRRLNVAPEAKSGLAQRDELARLKDIYKVPNEELAEYLGYRLSWM